MVCPWCLGKQKIFTRINLTLYLRHSSVVATGFYLAIYPDDYRRSVNISRYEQEVVLRGEEGRPAVVHATAERNEGD